MAVHIVQLGTPRQRGESLRLGTVRRPPRGVPKTEFSSRNYYDVWLPDVAPSEPLVRAARAATTDQAWSAFVKRYRRELQRPGASRLLDLIVAVSRVADVAVGCYCDDERRCHRSVLREVLSKRGADIARPEAGQDHTVASEPVPHPARHVRRPHAEPR